MYKHLLACAAFLVLSAAPALAGTLFFAGDSTLDEHGGRQDRYGSWGDALRPWLADGCRIVNYAKSGRSTKSFRDEGWWDRILAQATTGDVVVVQFGHNDQKLDKPKVAVPQPQFRQNLVRMAGEVRAKGAEPLFATPIVRLTFDKAGRLKDGAKLDDWAERMREAAAETGTPLVDMRRLTHAAAEAAGEAEALTWNVPGDRTHPAPKGAARYAGLFFDEIHARGLAVTNLFRATRPDTRVRTPAAAAVLRNLRAAAEKGSFYYAWCHPWVENAPAFRVETAEGPRPKAVADVDLSGGFGKANIGKTPCLYFTDFYFVTDATKPAETVAASRASLTAMVRAAWAKHRSVPVFSWHPENPYTPQGWKDPKYWYAPYRYRYSSEGYPQEHRYVVAEILRGEKFPREWYDAALVRIADFLKDLKDGAGEPIPAVVRLFHECEDDWQWWGRNSVSAADYREFFRYTVDRLRALTGGGANLLFAYSPDRYWKTLGEPSSAADFLHRYPGDDVVDIVGHDDYSLGHGKTSGECEKALAVSIGQFRRVGAFAHARGKVAGLFETGVKNSCDEAYDYIYRAMTAPGVQYGFLCTWGGVYSRPGTEAGRACWQRFADRPSVLTVESGASLVD